MQILISLSYDLEDRDYSRHWPSILFSVFCIWGDRSTRLLNSWAEEIEIFCISHKKRVWFDISTIRKRNARVQPS